MKKTVFVILVFLAVGFVTAGKVHAVETYTLWAGQNIEVGYVEVENDGSDLSVKYIITEPGWIITETHLYVGKNAPPTSSPGQFPYDDFDAVYLDDTEVDYLIPLVSIDSYSMKLNKKGKATGVMIADGDPGVDCDDEIYIAAHAVVENCGTISETIYPELTWSRSSESTVAVFPGLGAQWTQAEGFAIPTPDTFVWDGGESGQYFTGYSPRSDINWASWACTQPGRPSSTGTDLRRFNATFNIPAGTNVTGSTLGSVNPGFENVIPMNDTIYVFINGQLIFWGGTISVNAPGTTHFLGMERRATEPQYKPDFPETDGWYMDGTFPPIPSGLFNEGLNQLDVFAEEYWVGGGMHELGLSLEVEQTSGICDCETAWGEGDPIGDTGNWSMYFTYTIECGGGAS
jgi:hypothetical protein